MELKDIAEALVEGCRTHREEENLGRLYADDAVSVEAGAPPGQDRVSAGLDAIRGKHAWWNENFEVHEMTADGPYLHGDDRFAVIFDADSTMKQTGQRTRMREVGIYHVADGKIVREEFFYTGG
ncbi:nuclear transport factor 2 family protein [Oceaniglobus roseus]|uniref:nuclear transport factor 2 family protein n=1 Tax=Oceaniglobus roseus TaxID=1737570 RepID=UPI000C7EAAE5|nr:nuclear transport factor 2 family protein [Kandeliimicrobium roseum]